MPASAQIRNGLGTPGHGGMHEVLQCFSPPGLFLCCPPVLQPPPPLFAQGQGPATATEPDPERERARSAFPRVLWPWHRAGLGLPKPRRAPSPHSSQQGASAESPQVPPRSSHYGSTLIPRGHGHRRLIRETRFNYFQAQSGSPLLWGPRLPCQPMGDRSGIACQGVVDLWHLSPPLRLLLGSPQVPTHPGLGEPAHRPTLGLLYGFGAA